MKRKWNNYNQEIFSGFDECGRHYYYTLCKNCGRKAIYTKQRSVILCDLCESERKKVEKDFETDKEIKYEIRFREGISLLESCVRYIDEYKEAIKIAEKRKRRYASKDEVVAAIVLIHGGYSIIPQQKIGKYHADFLIPSKRLIVEIDGDIFHKDKQKELKRDNDMLLKLGFGWGIIHIPTTLLEKNPIKLLDAVKNSDFLV